ncbi:MAG: hypothetical protein ACYDCL_00380 [Myxococcales bacterium]
MHRDPFDRLLVSQAISRGMTVATPDEAIRAHPVAALWWHAADERAPGS